jgi:hypothetical protein
LVCGFVLCEFGYPSLYGNFEAFGGLKFKDLDIINDSSIIDGDSGEGGDAPDPDGEKEVMVKHDSG